MINPFISYYGGKWSMAARMGPPQRDLVIEPFAGSAGYSCYWEPKQVMLIEKDPLIYSIWNYLTHVSSNEIMRLPVDIDNLEGSRLCQEAKWLIGFWFNIGCMSPSKRRSNWGKKKQYLRIGGGGVWSAPVRDRIAQQIPRIRHWTVLNGSYDSAPDIEGHWHIDPPYQKAGKHYRYNSDAIDFEVLGRWCLDRQGFIQVCENDGADWLPFKPLTVVTGTRGRNRKGWSKEAVFQTGSVKEDLFETARRTENVNRGRHSESNGRQRPQTRRESPEVSGNSRRENRRVAGR